MELPKLSPEAQKVLENANELMIVKSPEITAAYDAAKKAKEILDTGITILDEIAGAVHEKNLAKARDIYQHKFANIDLNVDQGKHPFNKHSTDLTKLNELLDDQSVLLTALEKLKKAQAVMNKVMTPLKKCIGIYNQATKAADLAQNAYRLLEQSKKLSTADDYRLYNLEVARQFGEMCSIMKGMTDKLPPIMREYCKVVLSVGEKTQIMAKLVSDYTQVILKGIDETESEWSKVFNPETTNAYTGKLVVKMGLKYDLNDTLNLLE